MKHHFVLSRWRTAQSDRLDDTQLGMLLDDLQLGSEVTSLPERFRQALELVARSDDGAGIAAVEAGPTPGPLVRVA